MLIVSRLPIGFSPEKYVLTSDSLTMTTFDFSRISRSLNKRPLTSGMFMVRK